MPLTVEEMTKLAPEGADAIRAIVKASATIDKAFRRDEDGKVRLTMKERKAVARDVEDAGRLLLRFSSRLLLDTLD